MKAWIVLLFAGCLAMSCTLAEDGPPKAAVHEVEDANMKATKPNTWKDFIACGDYLVESGFSTKDKLAGLGGSAGGILIGRAITERPDLFAVACPVVGSLDTLRDELTPNGPPNIPEFGTVKIKAEFEALREMSTYEHIRPGPNTRLFCSITATMIRAFRYGCQQKQPLASRPIRRAANRSFSISTMKAAME
jgi:Prolyl oligopeptidase family